jgi:glycerol-3-phosphate acyltransferase PlsY
VNYLVLISVYLFAYLVGAIPFGYILVKLTKGFDIRYVQSGRTGGTNTMRAAGFWAGLSTALLDISKGAAVVRFATLFNEFDNPWLQVIVPIFAILGHNYSIYLINRTPEGKIKFHGGAGGAVCLGGSIGLWWPSGLIIFAIGALIFYFVGYASITTMSIAVLSTVLFALRAFSGDSPWAYATYGMMALILLIISLIPNIKSLIKGTERLHGFRARKTKHKDQAVSAA